LSNEKYENAKIQRLSNDFLMDFGLLRSSYCKIS